MVNVAESVEFQRLSNGIELAVLPLAARPVVAMEIRLSAGYVFEKPEYLGVANVLNEAITKGTAKHDGRGLSDAFDAIGATHDSFTGRETVGFSCLCLPEFFERAVELHAELIRTPTFPDDACEVAVDLSKQALAALNDDPQDLAKKLLHRQAYGEPLGRYVLGEDETLGRITREQVVDHWRSFFAASRMQVSVAGAVEPATVVDLLEGGFDDFGAGSKVDSAETYEPPAFPLDFSSGRSHHDKELEQEQIAICFPGSAVCDDDFPVQQVLIGVLAGGSSGRLFTEVREKQGLVYWVGAWSDCPRNAGLIHLGASTTPQRVDRTYATLLREIDRLTEDLTASEIERAITGIVTREQTRGDVTRSKALRLINDLFHYGRPIPVEEKLAKVKAVTVDDIQRYLAAHPRDQLSVVTLGPKALEV